MQRSLPGSTISRAGAAFFALVFAAAIALLVVPIPPGSDQLSPGDTAPRTLEARLDARYESPILTEEDRAAAAAAVPDVRVLDVTVIEAQTTLLTALFDQVRSVRARSDLTTVQQRLAALSTEPPAEALSGQVSTALLALDDASLAQVEDLSFEALAEVLGEPAAESEIPGRVTAFLDSLELAGASELLALEGIARLVAVPNFTVDQARTDAQREAARLNIAPRIQTFAAGQVIANSGDALSEADIEALQQTGVLEDNVDRLADAAAGIGMAAGLGLLFGVYLYALQPPVLALRRRTVLTGVVAFSVLLAARFVFPRLLPDSEEHYYAYAIPIAAAAMVASSFLELRFAAVVAAGLGLFAAFLAATTSEIAGARFLGPLQGIQIATTYTAAGLAGAVTLHRAERFGRFALAAVVVAFATWGSLAIFWLLTEDRTSEAFAWLSLVAALNGAASAVLALAAFVILSMLFGVTTRIQLMELAQADHPLMRRLQEDAPGTYHHSMMVGQMAERAANRIAADGLTARVGAYYHDIGKTARPEFFIENMLDGQPSPHDDLDPESSARLILDHVTQGIEIARRSRLPALVRDFIPQHHGTRLVTFFYRRALQQGETPDPERFRYRGPRPQTRESAIVMLADSCEAVVRAGGEPRREHLDDLVDGVFAERLAEGQLDECDITMRELQEVAASFKATLRAAYHPRIEYPSPRPEELAAIATAPDPSPRPQ
ncbi:MAG: HDIG domain-containing metalloprotein [Dehalococcoidia bacterium]